MIKKILLLTSFFIIFLAKTAYADPITAIISAIWSAALLHPFITWATILSLSYSIYSSITAAGMRDKLKYPSSRYSAPVIDNTYSNEGIVPLIYGGPIIVGGNILWQSDPATTVKRFLGLCVGEVSAITNVLVDDQDIAILTDCSYTAYYGTTTQTPDSRCDSAVKGLRDIAYLALTLTAGDKVSSNPIASARVTGRKIKTWNSITNSWDTNAVSSSKNPAAIIRDYLLLSATLGGCGLSESFIDNDSFGDVSEYCDVLVDNGNGGTEARYELDIILDTKHPVLDNIAKMLITFNGALIRSGATYKLVVEKSGETAVQAFTEDNITKGSFTYGYGRVEDTPNKLGVEWFEALEAKNPKRIAWSEDELDQEVHGVREEKIEALGIIRQSQSTRLAKKILYERKINDIWCEFESNISAMHCEPMDIISVTHSRPNWTAALFRIIEINETDFGNAKYSCQAYNSSVLDDGYGSTFDDWDYGSPPNPYESVTDVTNIALSEVGWLNTDGVWVINIDISWTAPATKKELLRNYIIELKKGSDAYKAYGIAPASATTYRISGNLKTGETYYVRIKTQSKYDIISDGTVSNPIILVGKTTNPSNVENFTYSWGKNIELSWGIVTDYDLTGYEIRDENANFGTDDAHLIYRGLTNRKVLIPASRAPGAYYIRAINASGYYSSISASIVPENKAPEIPLSLTPIIFFNLARLSWTDDTATDIEYYEVYVSKTNAWAGEESLLAKVPGKNLTVQGECPQNGISDDDGAANTNYVTDLDLSGWGPDYWKGSYIEIISGTGYGQELKISAYDTDLGKFTMTDNWATPPDTTSKFFVHPVRYYKVRGVDGFGPGNFTAACEVKFIEFTEGMLSDQIITARKIYAGEVITLSAQIRDAIIQNAHIIELSGDKITVQSITVSKLAADAVPPKTYYQAGEPASGMNEGDYWIDTDDSNKLYIYQGAAWVEISAASAGGITTFRQAGVPTALAAGDLWIDSDDSKLYRATNAGDDQVTAGEWELVNVALASGWTHGSDVTKIDGGKIYTGSIVAGSIAADTITADKYNQLRNTFVYSGNDSLDASKSYTLPFKIPSEISTIQSVKLSFQISQFRAYATTVPSGGNSTTASGGGSTSGAVSDKHRHTFTLVNAVTGGSMYARGEGSAGLGLEGGSTAGTWVSSNVNGHTHTFSLIVGGSGVIYNNSNVLESAAGGYDMVTSVASDGHFHYLHVNVGTSGNLVRGSGTPSVPNCSGGGTLTTTYSMTSDHTHTTPNHTHDTPAHTHSLTFGIFEDSTSPTIHFHIDNGAGFGAASDNYNADQLDLAVAGISGAGWKAIRFDTDLRCRISAIVECKVDIDA